MNQLSAIGSKLSTEGYAIIPNFLASSDVSADLLAWLKTAHKFTDGVINDIPPALMQSIQKRIQAVLPEIAQEAQLAINRDRYSYCAIRLQQAKGNPPQLRQPFDLHRDPKISEGGVLNWHLDHFSYYLYEDHTNWLICYIPILKHDATLANLGIIPYSTLQALDPHSYQKLHGRGAMRFRCVEADTLPWFRMRFPNETIAIGDWWAIDDFEDTSMGWKMALDLEQHKVVPALNQYDLLIMRADVIHKTNDAAIDRISVRCDAMPRNALNLESWSSIVRILLRLPFVSRKHCYNLRNWLKWVIPHKFGLSKP